MDFRILGPLEVLSDGRALDLGGAKQRALLAVLLLNANSVVSTDRLADALWEDDPPDSAQKALQVHVSSLRKLLGRERLQTKAPGYLLRVHGDELDLERFLKLKEQGQPGEALLLVRGPPLSDFVYRRFAQAEIARLEGLHLACLEERVEQDLQARRHAELTSELEALVTEHPLRERLRGQLMLALYRSGRQGEALEAYQAARRALVDELGIEPSRELRELHQRILNQDPALDLGPLRPTAPDREAAVGFVGRGPELGDLTAALDDALAGRGRLFLLQGEPGIGKSRLADELIGRARERGAQVLVGRCWEAGGAPAFWPWTQSLRAYVRSTEPGAVRRQLGASAAEVAQIVPQLRELFSGLSELEPSESEAARFRLFDATAAFLRNAAAEQPIVLVLDDLHAADEPSLLLLRYLASVLDDSPILVVGTFRDLDPTVQDPLEATIAELGRASVTRRIRLSGLSRDEVSRLAELTASTPPSQQLVAELYAETEGNPLFVSEIVRLLAAEGRLGQEWPGGIPIPETIREAIGRRLRTLSGECRRVLSLASVFGREFGLVALERVADYTGIDKLLSVLDEAVVARAIEEVPGVVGRLRFGHALTRDTLYEDIPATHRARLHRRVAEVLEALYAGNDDPHLAELAHHFWLAVPAAPPDKAVQYARRAADRALALLAYEEAARLYATALAGVDLSVPRDEPGRCDLLLSLGEAHARAGTMSAAKAAFLDGAEIAQRLHLPRELARAATGYGGRIVFERASSDDRFVPLLEAALAGAPGEDRELRSRLLARLAVALRDEHSRDRRDALSREAVELARQVGSLGTLAYAVDARAAAVLAPDTLMECLALATELLELGTKIGDLEFVAHAHFHRFVAHSTLAHADEARSECDAAGRAAEALGQPPQLWIWWTTRAMVALAAGELADAEELIGRAFALGEPSVTMASGVYGAQRYALCDFTDRLDEVEDRIRDLAANQPTRPVFCCLLAHLEARSGRLPAAQDLLGALAADSCAALPFDMEWLFGMSLLAETAALLRDAETAETVYSVLAPWGSLNVVDMGEGMRGSVARYLGLLATTMGRRDDAERHFENALEMNQRMGARPWLAYTQEDYARLLLVRGGPRDRERADGLLELARSTYRELGMRGAPAVASAASPS
jgi:DNA-binding SARP family transcriptional activator/tetratricopeptide (TPR) repeat protein